MFRLLFVQKRCLSSLSYWLIVERVQNLPDLRSPISKFWDVHFIIQLLISIVESFRPIVCTVSIDMTNILTFFLRWDHFTWPGDLTLSDLGLKCSHVSKTYTYGQVCQKRRHSAVPILTRDRPGGQIWPLQLFLNNSLPNRFSYLKLRILSSQSNLRVLWKFWPILSDFFSDISTLLTSLQGVFHQKGKCLKNR